MSTVSTPSGFPAWPGPRCTRSTRPPGIEWPVPVDPADTAQLSAKDGAQPTLAEALAAQA